MPLQQKALLEQILKQAVFEAENDFVQLFDLFTEAKFIVDGENLVFANKAALELFNYTHFKNKQDLTVYDLISPASYSVIRKIFETPYPKEKSILNFFEEIERWDGDKRFLEIIISPIIIKDKILDIAVLKDITETVRIKDELLKSELKFSTFIENTFDAFILVNRDLKIVYWNKAFKLMIKSEDIKITGCPISRFFEDIPLLLRQIADLGLNFYHNKQLIESSLLRNDGTEIPVEISISKVIINNEFTFLLIIRDISERKAYEKELQDYRDDLENQVNIRTSELKVLNDMLAKVIFKKTIAEEKIKDQYNFLKIIIDALPIPVAIKNKKKIYTHCNKAMLSFLELPVDKVIGKTIFDIYSEDYCRIADKVDERLLSAPGTEMYEATLEISKRKKYEIEVTKTTLTKNNGEIEGILFVINDLTDRKKLERELNNALEKEKDLSKLKSNLISMASHELKTPLTAILSSAEIIEMLLKKVPYEVNNQLKIIYEEIDKLVEIINDTLSLSNLETNKNNFNPVKTRLNTLCEEIIKGIKIIVPQNIELIYKYNTDQKYYYLDKKLIKQILYNLLNNAVKYTVSGGKIIFNVSSIENDIVFSIIDEGIGIPEQDLTNLFEAFHRGKNVKSISGTGLGLYIVKNSVEKHGGNITVKSELNRGTTFIINIPIMKNRRVSKNEKDCVN